MSHCDAGGQQEALTEKLTDYEKNKRKLKKSHIEMASCSTYGSTDRSDRALPPTATLRGTN